MHQIGDRFSASRKYPNFTTNRLTVQKSFEFGEDGGAIISQGGVKVPKDFKAESTRPSESRSLTSYVLVRNAMANVLLLRDRSEDTLDRYETAFSAAGYYPISIGVLETIHTNIPRLRDIIQEGPKSLGYNGVIVTSKRSCDAWREALQLLSDSAPDDTHAIGWCLYS